jgi:hypothetical protein
MQIGDVVSVRGRPGNWVVIEPDTGALPVLRWRVRQRNMQGAYTAHVAGEGDLALVTRPLFDAGQKVRYRGLDAVVVSDDGATVRVRYDETSFLRGGGRIVHLGSEADAHRANLVIENLSTLKERVQ